MSTLPAAARTPIVETRGVTMSFGKIVALEAVDFAVYPGEVVGLVGDNGAGKSTLIKILSGVHAPDAGEIFLDGQPVVFRSPKEARHLGIETVYQDLALVDQMSIARNFFLGKEPTRRLGPVRLLDRAEMVRATEQALREIGITSLRSAAEDVAVLSGGERQAIAIGRTMHFGAKLIILDEPTSALSIKETEKVLDYVRQARASGLGVVFISHNLYHVHPVADRVVVLEHGRKIGDFRKAEIGIEDLISLVAYGRRRRSPIPAPEPEA